MEKYIQTGNVIVDKSFLFAVRVVRFYKYLYFEKKESVLSKQILRLGTSIGANVKEAIRGQTDADFYSKMNIALKEASETEYWIELLYSTEIIDNNCYNSLIEDCRELIRILTAITKKQHNTN